MKQVTVEVLGVKLSAALLNHKVARKYDDGLKKVIEAANKATECTSGADGIEMECDAVIGFLDDIFGPGSAKKVLGEETDLLTCLDAWEDLVELYEKQVDPILKQRTKVLKEKFEKNGDA